MKNKTNEPKAFSVMRILGAILLVCGIPLVVVGGLLGLESSLFWLMFVGVGFLFVGLSILFVGCWPLIDRLAIKTTKHMMSSNKEDLKDIADTGADIVDGALGKTAKSITRGIKQGLNDTEEATTKAKYCKHCGAKIDEDSKFCKECGGKL